MLRTRIEGIDYLRAIMSVFVVVWHMQGAGRSIIFIKDRYLEHEFAVSDFINFHILLLAVPMFIFISNYLYASGDVNIISIKRRIIRLLLLLSFWPTALIIFRSGYLGLKSLIPYSLGSLIGKVLTAGGTIYYFFVCLILCLLITHVMSKCRIQLQLLGFISSTIILAVMPAITSYYHFYPLSAYWNPINFLPYPFMAILLSQNMNYIHTRKALFVFVSICLALISAVLEWHYYVGEIFFPGQGYAIPAYTRTSLLFSVIAISILLLDPRIASNAVVKYMAKNSLALYCLHPFLIGTIRVKILTTFDQIGVLSTYLSIALVILFSYALAIVLRMYVREDIII